MKNEREAARLKEIVKTLGQLQALEDRRQRDIKFRQLAETDTETAALLSKLQVLGA